LVKLQLHGLLPRRDSVCGRRELVFLQKGGKCVGNSRGIKPIRAELVFRGTHQECSHNSNEISAFLPELVFRQIPGKSVQRGWQAQWLWLLFLRVPLQDPVGCGIIRIRCAPPWLGVFFRPCRLALWLAAGMLARPHSCVGTEPMTAKGTRPLPGRGHRDSSSQRAAAPRRSPFKLPGSFLESRGGKFFASAEASRRKISRMTHSGRPPVFPTFPTFPTPGTPGLVEYRRGRLEYNGSVSVRRKHTTAPGRLRWKPSGKNSPLSQTGKEP